MDSRQQVLKSHKTVTTDQFNTIFEDPPQKQQKLEELRQRKLKSVLEEARTKGQVYDQEREKIILRFPKNFNLQMEDMLGDMQQQYAGVMEAQQKIEKNRIERINFTLQELERDIESTEKCKNPKLLEALAPGLVSAYAYSADQIIDLLVDDMIEELITYMNELEQMQEEKVAAAEVMVQKNRIKKRLADSEALHAWKLIEALEQYKDELGY